MGKREQGKPGKVFMELSVWKKLRDMEIAYQNKSKPKLNRGEWLREGKQEPGGVKYLW